MPPANLQRVDAVRHPENPLGHPTGHPQGGSRPSLLGYFLPLMRHLPLGGPQQRPRDPKEGRLATTRRPDDGQELTGAYIEGCGPEDGYGSASVGVGDAHVTEGQEGLAGLGFGHR